MLQKPTLSPQPQHHNRWKSCASAGCCRDMPKTDLRSRPLHLFSPGTLSPMAKETLQASLCGDREESGDNRGLQQESSPRPRCGSPGHCLAIKSWRATATAPGATAPMARGMQERGPPGQQPRSPTARGAMAVEMWHGFGARARKTWGKNAPWLSGSLPHLPPAPRAPKAPPLCLQGPALP